MRHPLATRGCDLDSQVTQKEFAFPKKHNMELFYCSASDGTNVVSAFNAAIEKAVEYSKSPSDDFVDQARTLTQIKMSSLARVAIKAPARQPIHRAECRKYLRFVTDSPLCANTAFSF
eukprot:5418184-Pleurochrysis_carterae.AAC.3